MINLEAFEPFLEHVANAELVEAKLYGIVVLNKDNTFSTETIVEDDLVKYEHVNFLDIEDDELKESLIKEAYLISDSNPAWPIVKLIEW